ncbi:MAG: hypothetical protein ACXVJB_02565 [Mucilaginibacter sp.]
MKTAKNNKRTIAGKIITGGTGALILLTAPGFAQTHAAANASDAIRPFHVNISKEELTDLRRRVLATRWPDRKLLPINPRACSCQLSRHWPITGPQHMIGASARRS